MATSIANNSQLLCRLLAERHIEVTFGVSAYNEGSGIVSTLASLWNGIQELGLEASPIVLSDSSSTMTTVQAAKEWAAATGACLIVNHSDERRSLKSALNTIINDCHSDFLIVSVGDVLIPSQSLVVLIDHLLSLLDPDVVIGATRPDPSVHGLGYKAGAWQLNAVARLAASMPYDEIRAEGAFWGAKCRFFEEFRYSEGIGSLSDDVQLQQAVIAGNYKGVNAPSAFVYKIPPGTIYDFCLQTCRYHFAIGEYNNKRTKKDYLALGGEVINDPIGFLLYLGYRLYAVLFAKRFESSVNTEMWETSITTKRVASSGEEVLNSPSLNQRIWRFVVRAPTVRELKSSIFEWLLRLKRFYKLLRHLKKTRQHVVNVINTFQNWPSFLFKVGLYYFGLARGDLAITIKEGPRIVCWNNPESWFPVFEVFIDDVYRLDERLEKKNSFLQIIDIGGHIGSFTVAVATHFPNATVYVYEPAHLSYQYLIQNISNNNLSSRVNAVEAAVGMHDGRELFYEAGEASCGASLSPTAGGRKQMVKVVSFDVIMEEFKTCVDILKIDCEGEEYNIILNSKNSSWEKVQTLLLEYHPIQGHTFLELDHRLRELGFIMKWQEDTPVQGIGLAYFTREKH